MDSHSLTISNILSEAIGSVAIKFNVKLLWTERNQIYIIFPDHMTNRAAMSVDSKHFQDLSLKPGGIGY